MIVGELIEVLKRMPPEREIMIEGCDCWGDVHGATIVGDGIVLITRSDGDMVNDR